MPPTTTGQQFRYQQHLPSTDLAVQAAAVVAAAAAAAAPQGSSVSSVIPAVQEVS